MKTTESTKSEAPDVLYYRPALLTIDLKGLPIRVFKAFAMEYRAEADGLSGLSTLGETLRFAIHCPRSTPEAFALSDAYHDGRLIDEISLTIRMPSETQRFRFGGKWQLQTVVIDNPSQLTLCRVADSECEYKFMQVSREE